MKTLRLLLGDQLSYDLPSLVGLDKNKDIVVMAEVVAEVTYVRHHKRKVAFLFSAMRHFAERLRADGVTVLYRRLDDPDNAGSLGGEVRHAIAGHAPDRLVLTAPGEYRLLQEMQAWQNEFSIPVEILPDSRFLCGLDEFADWAKGRKTLRMEFFYRELRRRYDVLMEGGAPIGGKWNYDSDNRQPPKAGLDIPPPCRFGPDHITRDVLTLVEAHCADHFGRLEGFDFAVTHDEAAIVLDRFVAERLPCFGDYQDAMLENEPWMYHSHIGLYLNAGLLSPLAVIRAAEAAYHSGAAPLNAVEGFIRQILGWREFVRGLYWLKMPDYAAANYFAVYRPLPDFFWSGNTGMNCLAQAVRQTESLAYAHHIQRLMVLGNFALLAGLSPAAVNEWFLVVYADAYEWVVLPNVSGMALFADGGYLASKPYAAGGAYINRMSNYCKNCRYDVMAKAGDTACPFNYLYWDFLARHRDKLSDNARLGMIYRTLDRMSANRRAEIKADAGGSLAVLTPWPKPGEVATGWPERSLTMVKSRSKRSIFGRIMRLVFSFGLIVTTFTALSSCARRDVTALANRQPPLVLEEFFDGDTVAFGIFEDRFGNLRRQFRVALNGTVTGNRLVLEEAFLYEDGEAATRIWTIDNLGLADDGTIRYQGRANDIDGVANGRIAGNGLNWAYDVSLQMSGLGMNVHFDDWIYRQSEEIAINRAYVTKYGVEIGSVTIVFLRGKVAAAVQPLDLENWVPPPMPTGTGG